MPHIEIYTKSTCGYCRRAKALLSDRGLEFTEIDVGWDPEAEAEMLRKAGGAYTVPQIFINGHHVGGSEELAELDAAGNLDALLQDKSSVGEM